MDISRLQNIFKKFDLLEDTPVKKLELDSVSYFQENIKFLKNFAKFLSLYKGKEQAFIMVKDLAEISSDPKQNDHSNDCLIFDFKTGYQEFKSGLPENVDINYCVLELFSNCLLHIIDQIHREPEIVTDLYEHFLDIRDCIFTFSESPIILDTKGFKNTVSFFIADLMKILTGSEFSVKRTNLLQVYNLIRRILNDLANNITYRDLILRQILKRIKCALSYSKANANFDGYITSYTFVFEYFFWIIQAILSNCCDMGSNLDDNLIMEMKEVLEEVKKCLENKISLVVMKLLEKILVVL